MTRSREPAVSGGAKKGVRLVVAAAALLLGGFMLVDGARALVAGDYFTPRHGDYAGQLGPWARLVASAGMDPRGAPMKWTFVTIGAGWLVALAAFIARASWASAALVALAIATLWYLPFGTVLALLVIALLAVLRVRARA